MANLRELRPRIILTVAVLVILDLALVVYLAWPGMSTRASERAQEQALQEELHAKTREVAPLHGIDQKLIKVRSDLSSFYQHNVPNRWSEISERLQKLEAQAGVVPQTVSYTEDKTALSDVQRIKINTTISGDYSNIMRFINALERDNLLFKIEQVSLSGQQGGAVAVQIKLETFLRETA